MDCTSDSSDNLDASFVLKLGYDHKVVSQCIQQPSNRIAVSEAMVPLLAQDSRLTFL